MNNEALSPELLQRFLVRERQARKAAEQLLEERSRQLYLSNVALEKEMHKAKSIFETAAEGILIFDAQGKIESLNCAAKDIFGIGDSDCENLNVCDLVPSATFCANRQGCHNLINHVNSIQQHGRNEMIGRRRDGSDIPLEFAVSEFLQYDVIIYSGIVRDLSRRKALESQLAHAQKMESVGQLAAGIAHELNTPIQFVGDNTRFLRSSFSSIHELLDQVQLLVEQCASHHDLALQARAVRDFFKTADIEFLKEEIPLAIEQTLEGAETVARIVRAMKVFSHPGAQEFQETNLNASLESTLTISRSEWKYCAELETEFDPNLPNIMCMPGELNQAFLNLVVNGAHAIAAKSDQVGILKVRTSSDHDKVVVEISDSGTGIPKDIRNKIFDPFFTTKGVGKGTGQGLSICYHIIVEVHSGRLTFESLEGQGTTFRIELPIDPRRLQQRIENV